LRCCADTTTASAVNHQCHHSRRECEPVEVLSTFARSATTGKGRSRPAEGRP
jgi:hypothetical protein